MRFDMIRFNTFILLILTALEIIDIIWLVEFLFDIHVIM